MKWWTCSKSSVMVFFLCFSIEVLSQITHPDETLREIRSNLEDPLKRLSNWKHGDPCMSNWTGIVCYNTTLNDGYLHVQELELLNFNLTGSLSPELGNLSHLKILDFMWNKISGSIPKEIGKIKTLELLLVNGNQLTGPLPEELGYLPNLNRIQIDQNYISGELPKSFANLNKTKHFHMNNNSISGQIPHELSRLPSLVHFLLDNNNLTGHLPPEFSKLPNLLILQLDNNNFEGTTIPASYGNMSKLLKLSIRNCRLQGPIPDLSAIPHLGYLDLSSNQLNGSIPANKLSDDITTIILSNNSLTGNISANFAGLPRLQKLSLADNKLSGSIPSALWQKKTSVPGLPADKLLLDFENNRLSGVTGSLNLPPNVTLLLRGNPLCSSTNYLQFCKSNLNEPNNEFQNNVPFSCPSQACPPSYEYSPSYPVPCVCAAPLIVGYRLKSPGFKDFLPYRSGFEKYLSSGLTISPYQLDLDSFMWQDGPRLKINLKLFPAYNVVNDSHLFNDSEFRRLCSMFTRWNVPDNDTFGPYELLDFVILDPYVKDFGVPSPASGLSKGAIAGIVLGAVAVAVTLSAVASLILYRLYLRKHHGGRKSRFSRNPIKVDGVRRFGFGELSHATNNFSDSAQVGQGGYGKVYKGILADGTVVAIKRAQEGSLQGQREFCTEIELLSRIHHRNLVSLVGYCDEEDEQMLVYEFMPNQTLRDHISGKTKQPLNFESRLRIALGSAKGILYLHSEADPPIFHRDIKASNILLDSKFTAKVADFGLSRLAPVPDKEGVTPAHVSTVVKGTPGYLDPEYFATFKLTDKSDVYSLGVVFLELLTGMHPISRGKHIVREVNTAYQSGIVMSLMDESMGPYQTDTIIRFVKLALRCCHDETNARPSMMEIVRELEDMSDFVTDSDSGMTGSSRGGADSSVGFTSMKNPYMSSDISGSDLVSGVLPNISPR
ncbi:hypothetical protein RND81_12G218100 [Saponaria officinalis]|uniref:non-specific serine/threonine protein kinase n=1 Tax=Saponaria officinalis TaxID=3572 RepID=A0AAW1HDW0_SAPOF